MRGLPYKVTTEETLGFFEGYGELAEDNIYIEEFNGRRTGSALVIFKDSDLAQDCKKKFNKKELGPEGRYVELYDCYDQFMKKICNLAYD